MGFDTCRFEKVKMMWEEFVFAIQLSEFHTRPEDTLPDIETEGKLKKFLILLKII